VRYLDGQLLCSATDLVGFSACRHLTALELRAARGELDRPVCDDPFVDVLTQRGDEHEHRTLDAYGRDGDGDDVVEITADTSTLAGLRAAADETIAAMRAGARVIYQATFLHDGWVGHADFVERDDTVPSALGDWSYRPVDSKLARSVKASALVQLAEYAEHITRVQGVEPVHVVVMTGDGERHETRLADVAAYHRSLKHEFVAAVANDTGGVQTYPDPVDHCSVCRWSDACADRRRADDHLSLVAGIRAAQIEKLTAVGITTRHALADAPDERPCKTIGSPVYMRLRKQAALQVAGEGCVPPRYELLPPELDDDGTPTRRGLAALPPPSPGDLFLDLEGDPLALDGGLEYLFGIVELVDGEPVYHRFWAHTRDEERTAFEAAVDFIKQRRERDPGLHVYHYASYEPNAFKKLMGAHGTCEDAVDDFLRGEVFVDLFRVVKQSVLLSTESYSLKQVEKLYADAREGEVLDAGSSIVAYEQYLRDPDPHRLDEIAAYNRDDCTSLVPLRAWLEARRIEAQEGFDITIPRPTPPEVEAEDEEVEERAALAQRLIERDGTNALLGHLLEWHRREAKPEWWKYFARCNEYEPDDFVRDTECIGGIELGAEIGQVQQSLLYELHFDPQDHKFSKDSEPVDPATGKQAGTIVELGDDRLVLKRGKKRVGEPLPHALIPGKPIPTDAQRNAIRDVAEWVADHGVDAPGPYRAVRDLLLRERPRGIARMPDVVNEQAARNVARSLDHGCLAVQGPPGTGKTHTGARMIVELLRAGRTVGITATTHNAIGNLLEKVVKAGAEEDYVVTGIQKADGDQRCDAPGIECTGDAADVDAALASGEHRLAAGTAWLWSRQSLRESLDVLVIDEAGQMSLADVLAVGTAARSIILLGDPQQLAQPSQGSHPDGAGASALQHLLGDHETIPPDQGLFLPTTWRMHPDVCAFVSEIAYEGRLHSKPELARQSVDGRAGLWWVPVDHDGDPVRSRDEALAVAGIVRDLLGTPHVDADGNERPLTTADVLVVAPYNAHVAELRKALPSEVAVGTVDKFQGREGAVAIYSMASSSVEDAPRGMSFLYDLHRLNVAVSRAQARAYVVASPRLLRVLCETPKQIRLVNALCRYVERACEARAGAPA
jgi:uncharacterized protein